MPRKIRSNYMEQFKFTYNGKTFESKRKCCKYYGICYRSVMAYQDRHKCRTEEAVTHFIELKKSKEIIFRNRKWSSIKTCCEFYDLNVDSVKTNIWNRKCTPQEALEQALETKKKREILYHGVKYPSLPKCCEEFGINPVSVRLYMDENGVSATRAITHYIKSKEKRTFTFKGKEYESFSKCCLAYGQKQNSVSAMAHNAGCSNAEMLEKIVAHMKDCVPLNDMEKDKAFEEQVLYKERHRAQEAFFCEGKIFRGTEYPSLRACCKKYGIDDMCVRQRAKDKNCSLEESFHHFMTRKRKKLLNNPEFEYHGTIYLSLKACCEELEISKNSVVSRSRRTGCSLQEAVDHYVRRKECKELD